MAVVLMITQLLSGTVFSVPQPRDFFDAAELGFRAAMEEQHWPTVTPQWGPEHTGLADACHIFH